MNLEIPLTDFTKLVDGEITLEQLIQNTPNQIDDAVFAQARVALSLLAGQRALINAALGWLKLPITVRGIDDVHGDMPAELKELDADAFASLKDVLHAGS